VSAISVILLLAACLALAVCTAALRAARGLREQVAALRADLSLSALPAARSAPDEELIRAAVADALADERDRELAEARAFWAEQEARDAVGSAGLTGPLPAAAPGADEVLLDALLERYLTDGDVEDLSAFGTAYGIGGYLDDAQDGDYRGHAFLPRQGGAADSADDSDAAEGAAEATGPAAGTDPADPADEDEQWAAELAAARRRHPSHPGYTLSGEPVSRPSAATGNAAEEYERTTERLSRLARSGTPLADVRPGPLGTLDVFLFADGTTLCLSPGHRETSQRLASAVRSGEPPVLLGGSGVSGAYALTFGCGEESIYLLADRIVTA
jgi:hypothetical protein